MTRPSKTNTFITLWSRAPMDLSTAISLDFSKARNMRMARIRKAHRQGGEPEDDGHHQLLHRQRGEEVAVHLAPILGVERVAVEGEENVAADALRRVEVIDLELETGDRAIGAEVLLRLGQREVGELGVVLVHPRVEDGRHPERPALGDGPVRPELAAQRADHVDLVAHVNAETSRELTAEDDPGEDRTGWTGLGGGCLLPCRGEGRVRGRRWILRQWPVRVLRGDAVLLVVLGQQLVEPLTQSGPTLV